MHGGPFPAEQACSGTTNRAALARQGFKSEGHVPGATEPSAERLAERFNQPVPNHKGGKRVWLPGFQIYFQLDTAAALLFGRLL
ncbi:MAG: hypothetical protein GDA39_08685 [Hyphomonadaceae bacterium]|nr:hypothetical protein [Hyphomonadaceae bacterium]MBC6412928.1 hypothetical protein [Hyphomonadaceae bacterium]